MSDDSSMKKANSSKDLNAGTVSKSRDKPKVQRSESQATTKKRNTLRGLKAEELEDAAAAAAASGAPAPNPTPREKAKRSESSASKQDSASESLEKSDSHGHRGDKSDKIEGSSEKATSRVFKRDKEKGGSKSHIPSGSLIRDESTESLAQAAAPTNSLPLETQVFQLDNHSLAGNSKAHLEPFSHDDAASLRFRDLFALARRLNFSFASLEVVIVGPAGAGKTSLVEALIGEPCAAIGTTRRVIQYNLIHDPVHTKLVIREGQQETVVASLDHLPKEIARFNKRSSEPLIINLEGKWGVQMAIIDTPPLRNIEDLARWAASPAKNRVIVAVERAPLASSGRDGFVRSTDKFTMMPLLKKVDPHFGHSILVVSGWDEFLKSYESNTQGVYFAVNNENFKDAPVFWMTLPTDEVRGNCHGNSVLYKQRLWQYLQNDLESLRGLDVDALHSVAQRSLGPYQLRAQLVKRFEKNVARLVPDLQRAFAENKALLVARINNVNTKLTAWTIDNVRALASKYATRYMRFVDDLTRGSVQGHPSTNGQTQVEEKQELKFEWNLGEGKNANVLKAAAKAQAANLKLYGAPQLYRLLDEFRLLSNELQMPTLGDVELSITSLDPAWTAAEIARSKVEQQFVPLMEQLLERAYHIMKRLSTVCDAVADEALTPRRGLGVLAENRTSTHQAATGLRDLDAMAEDAAAAAVAQTASAVTQRDFPGFSSFIRQSFRTALGFIQQKCQTKCADEFYSAHTLYWELTGSVDMTSLLGKDVQAKQNALKQLVQKLYNEIKTRLIDSFVRNIQTYFLSQTSILELSKSVVAEVNTLPDARLREMFRMDQIKETLQAKIKALQVHQQLTEQEMEKFQSSLLPALLASVNGLPIPITSAATAPAPGPAAAKATASTGVKKAK